MGNKTTSLSLTECAPFIKVVHLSECGRFSIIKHSAHRVRHGYGVRCKQYYALRNGTEIVYKWEGNWCKSKNEEAQRLLLTLIK